MHNRAKSVLLLLALTLAVTGCGNKAAVTNASDKNVVPVQVEQVTSGNLKDQASIAGKFSPKESASIAPKVSGKISQINVELGQFVNQGDTLFALDEADLQNTVKQTQAAYQVALANLKQAENSSEQGIEQAQSNVVQTNNSVTQAMQAYQDAQKSLERTQQLFGAGAVPSVDMEKAQTAFKNAEVALQNAQTAYDNAQNSAAHTAKETSVEVAKASVEQAKVNLANAQDQRANAVVKAPISGTIASINGTTGQMTGPQSPVVTIANVDPILVKANLSENDVTRIKVGAPVTVEVPAVNKEVEAKVTAISPVMDAQLKAYPMEISIPNPDKTWKSDMVVNITFHEADDTQSKTLIVSRKSVFDEQNKRYVYKVDGDTAKKTEVTTGEETSKMIVIKSGLAEKDTIVAKGQTLLTDGAKIEIQK